MTEYYKYRPKSKHLACNKCVCPQKNVTTKDVIIKFRLTSDMKNKIRDLAKEKGKSTSELTRLLWEDYLTKKQNIEWQKEVEAWFDRTLY